MAMAPWPLQRAASGLPGSAPSPFARGLGPGLVPFPGLRKTPNFLPCCLLLRQMFFKRKNSLSIYSSFSVWNAKSSFPPNAYFAGNGSFSSNVCFMYFKTIFRYRRAHDFLKYSWRAAVITNMQHPSWCHYLGPLGLTQTFPCHLSSLS